MRCLMMQLASWGPNSSLRLLNACTRVFFSKRNLPTLLCKQTTIGLVLDGPLLVQVSVVGLTSMTLDILALLQSMRAYEHSGFVVKLEKCNRCSVEAKIWGDLFTSDRGDLGGPPVWQLRRILVIVHDEFVGATTLWPLYGARAH
eukprot:689003-Amphidinium_carterae.1